MATTNYVDTFIAVADDSRRTTGTVPPTGEQATVARLTWEVLTAAPPYSLTSDDVLFAVHVVRTGVGERDRTAAKEAFLARSHPCMRASPLTKSYGWGIYSNATGHVALYGMETQEYRSLSAPGAKTTAGSPITQKRAMASRHRVKV